MTLDDRLRRARSDYRALDTGTAPAFDPTRPASTARRGRAVLAVAVGVAACLLVALAVVMVRADDGPTGLDTVAPPDTAPAPAGTVPAAAMFPDCATIRSPEAPAERYRATPAYVGNEYPLAEVKAWAQTQPGYVSIWSDRDRNGWLTVAFTVDADLRQADLDRLFPDVGVVAVAVDYTVEGLLALQARLSDVFRGSPVGLATIEHMGVVQVDLGYKTPERLAELEPFVGERICVNGLDAEDAVQPGPQPTGGDGWRLLGDGLTGPSFRTGVATDEAQYTSIWAEAGLTVPRPTVDFEREIVVWFGAVYGSSCPIRLDDVVVDREAATIHAGTVVPSNQTMCTSDARPHAYVVAIDRSALPVGPFAVQLRASAPPVGVPEERTLVAVDLSAPGSTARDDQIGTDPALVGDTDRRNAGGSGGTISVGDAWPYRLVAACGAQTLGVVNGVLWETSELAAGELPAAWASLADASGVVTLDIVLDEAGPTLVATADGLTITYQPSAADRSRYDWRTQGECVAPYEN